MPITTNPPPDPFQSAHRPGVGVSEAENRIWCVGSFTRRECEEALARHKYKAYLQRSVVDAINSRLRRLDRLEATR